jgi:hypothetical protein
VANVQCKTPDDWQRACPEHAEFLDKNKFGKLMCLLVLLKRKYLGLLPWSQSDRGVKLTMHLHLTPNTAIPLLPKTLSWLSHGQI